MTDSDVSNKDTTPSAKAKQVAADFIHLRDVCGTDSAMTAKLLERVHMPLTIGSKAEYPPEWTPATN